MTQNRTKPPRGRVPTVGAILQACPWSTRGNDDAKEAARRLATQLQAREYLLWLIEEHPPNLTLAHGVTELMWSRDGSFGDRLPDVISNLCAILYGNGSLWTRLAKIALWIWLCSTGPAGLEPATPGFGDRCSTN